VLQIRSIEHSAANIRAELGLCASQLPSLGTLLKWTRRLPTGEDMQCEFCDRCGTRVFHVSESYRAKGIVSIKPGTIDDTRWIRPRAQIWLERAQSWLAFKPDAVTALLDASKVGVNLKLSSELPL
jgi:hypothetical protein